MKCIRAKVKRNDIRDKIAKKNKYAEIKRTLRTCRVHNERLYDVKGTIVSIFECPKENAMNGSPG